MSKMQSLNTRVAEFQHIHQTYYLWDGHEKVFFVENMKDRYPHYFECVEAVYVNYENNHHNMLVLSSTWHEEYKTANMKKIDDMLSFIAGCSYITNKLFNKNHLIVFISYSYHEDGHDHMPWCYIIDDPEFYKSLDRRNVQEKVDDYVSNIEYGLGEECHTKLQETVKINELMEIHYWA